MNQPQKLNGIREGGKSWWISRSGRAHFRLGTRGLIYIKRSLAPQCGLLTNADSAIKHDE